MQRLGSWSYFHAPKLRRSAKPVQGTTKDVRLILDGMPAVGPAIDRRVQSGVDCEVGGIALMGGPSRQLSRWNQPALGEQGGTALLPEIERQPKIVGSHEGVAAHMEADQVVAASHSRTL